MRTLWPTTQSRAAYGEIKAVAGEVYEQALKGLAPAERSELIRALELMSANLADDETEAACEAGRAAFEKATS